MGYVRRGQCQGNHNGCMLPRLTSLAAFTVAATLLASVVYWGLKLLVRAAAVPAHASLATAMLPPAPDWSRLFGVELAAVVAEATAPPPDTRYQLIGVVAPRGALGAASGGLAVIAVDGKPPRTYRVGAVIDGPTVLQGVQQRGASLGPRGGAPTVSLQVAPLPTAATGVPTPAAPAAAPPPAFPGMPVPPPPVQQVPGPAVPRTLLPPNRGAIGPFSSPEVPVRMQPSARSASAETL